MSTYIKELVVSYNITERGIGGKFTTMSCKGTIKRTYKKGKKPHTLTMLHESHLYKKTKTLNGYVYLPRNTPKLKVTDIQVLSVHNALYSIDPKELMSKVDKYLNFLVLDEDLIPIRLVDPNEVGKLAKKGFSIKKMDNVRFLSELEEETEEMQHLLRMLASKLKSLISLNPIYKRHLSYLTFTLDKVGMRKRKALNHLIVNSITHPRCVKYTINKEAEELLNTIDYTELLDQCP